MKQTFLIGILFGTVLGFWLAAQVRVLNFPTLHLPKHVTLNYHTVVDIAFVLLGLAVLYVLGQRRGSKGGRK
jgi:ABC-type lipoprotein release transport system permease subunit